MDATDGPTDGTRRAVADRPIGEFLDAVAAGSVTPGGGATAAVAGAGGAALGEMVCSNTLGGDPDGRAALEAARADLTETRRGLLGLADDDVAAVRELVAAYGADDPDRRAAATETATEVPLDIAEASAAALEATASAIEHGNPNAVPDGVVGAHLAHAALTAALYTVEVNLAYLDDADAAAFEERAAAVEAAGEERFASALAAADAG